MKTKRATDRSVLILTNQRDFAADAVIRCLQDRDLSVRRLNVEDALSAPLASEDPAGQDAPRVLWWRQFQPYSHLGGSQCSLSDIDDVLVTRAQWSAWLNTWDRPETTWINPLWAARRAEQKIVQLRTARSIGFNTPETLVTNDPRAASEFASHVGGCVVKSLAAGYFEFSGGAFTFTEPFDDASEDPELWHRQPVIVQQRIRGQYETRLVVFGDNVFGARLARVGVDWRKVQPEGLWEEWRPPAQLVQACLRYMSTLGLRYAAFDFVLADDDAWFLEANQAGEWLFLDRQLKFGIAEALAGYLAELARE